MTISCSHTRLSSFAISLIFFTGVPSSSAVLVLNPVTPKSDQVQISPAASPGNITSYGTKNLAFHSLLRLKDDYYQFSLHYLCISVGRMYFFSWSSLTTSTAAATTAVATTWKSQGADYDTCAQRTVYWNRQYQAHSAREPADLPPQYSQGTEQFSRSFSLV